MIDNERLDVIAHEASSGEHRVMWLPCYEMLELVKELKHYREQHAQPLIVPVYNKEQRVDGYVVNPNLRGVRRPEEATKKGKRKK